MAVAFVQRADYASSSKATSHPVTWPGATAAGNLLLLYVDFNEEGVVTTATVPAGWTLAVGPVEHQSTSNAQIKGAIYYKQNAASQSGTVTVTLDSSHHCRLHLAEYSGVATTSALGATAQNHGSSTTLDSGTTTTTAANSLTAALLACKNVNAEAIVPATGWSQTSEVGESSGAGAAGRSGTYRNLTLGSAASAHITATVSASVDWVGMLAEFKAAGSAAVTVEMTSIGASTSATLLGGVGNRTNSNNDALASSMAKYPNIGLACFYAKMATIEPAAPTSITSGTYQWGTATTGLRGAIQNAITHSKRLILRFEWGYGVAAWMFTTGIQPCTEVFLIDPVLKNTSSGASTNNLHSPLPWTSSGDGTPNVNLVAHYTRFLRALNAELLAADGVGGVQADHVYHVAMSMPTMFPGTEMSLGYGPATTYSGAYDGPAGNVSASPTIKSINLAEQNTHGTESNRRIWYLDAWDKAAALHNTYLTSVPSSIAYGTSFGSYSDQPNRAKLMVAAYGKRICHITTDLQPDVAVGGTYAGADAPGAATIAAAKSVGGWVGFQAATEQNYPSPLNSAIKSVTDDGLATYGMNFFEPADPLLGDTYPAATDGSGWGGIDALQTRILAQATPANGGVTASLVTAPAAMSVATNTGILNVEDTFTRTVAAGGLGSANLGELWTLTGTAANFAVNGSAATVAVTAANQTKRAVQADVTMDDVAVVGQFQIDTLPAGAGTFFDLVTRYVDANNHYRSRCTLAGDGSIQLRVYSVVGGVATLLNTAATTPLTVQTANDYTLLFQCQGTTPTTLQLYLWDSSSPPASPVPWQVVTSDSASVLQVADAVGFECALASGSTAATTTFQVSYFSAFPSRMTGESDMVFTTADAPMLTTGKVVPAGQGTRKIQTPRS